MAQFIRSSKFKHVFCDPPRTEAQYTNLRLSTVTGEHNYIKANPKYFAVALAVRMCTVVCRDYVLLTLWLSTFAGWWRTSHNHES
jgi:hypothetical protein